MQKKISTDQIRIGMFIDKLEGSWINSPFWKTAFKLSDKKDLKSLRASGIRQVWIDTDKGLDVELEQPKAIEKATIKTEKKLPATETPVSLEEEMEQAHRIQAQVAPEVASMFQDARMGKAVQAEDALPVANEIYLSVMRNPGALISLTRLKTTDNYTYMHSIAVCALMIALGRQLALDDAIVKSLGMAGLLHDLGKMAIPDEILNKPGRLTDDEFGIIKTHPERGWEMLQDSSVVDEITLDVCLHHHEKVDGSGYPEKLSADNMSLFAKMGAVCDVYDAVTSDRSYKTGWAPADSIRRMASWKHGHFDGEIFDNFVRTVGIYPIGTLVKLSTGRLAIVVDSGKDLLKPRVKAVYSITANTSVSPTLIDLEKQGGKIEGIEDPAKFGIDVNKILGISS